MVHLADVKRDSGFEYVPQAQRELTDRAIAFDEIVSDLNQFQIAWKTGETPQTLSARFRFKKVHDAECERRGILLYEIYVQRGKYRAVIAWVDSDGPGYWVSFFKKQGSPQSKVRLRTAGERAVNCWRQTRE